MDGLAGASVFTAFARNISLEGAFIETPHAFAVNEEIVLSFALPDQDERIGVLGKVARHVPGGFGITFVGAPERLATMIESLP